MHRVQSWTTKAVRTPRRLRSLWRLRVGAVAGLGLATTVALLPSGPVFGAGVHLRRRDPPLQVAHIVSLASGGKPVLSKLPADYIPATISGQKVVIDPRSSVGHTDPSCQIPPEGRDFIPLERAPPSEVAQGVSGGLWDCPAGAPFGTGFVAGIDAATAVPTASKLGKKSLYALSDSAEAGSVKTTTVKVNGKRVKVFTFRTTALFPPLPPDTVFENASAEPHAHLLISTTTPSGTNPVPYLTAMLKAGAGKTPRAS